MSKDLYLSFDELNDGDLPPVCFRCGRDTEDLIRVDIESENFFEEMTAKICLPLCRQHARKNKYGHHDIFTREHHNEGIYFKNACTGFMDAVEDYRESRKRFRREQREREEAGEYDYYEYGVSNVSATDRFFDKRVQRGSTIGIGVAIGMIFVVILMVVLLMQPLKK